MSPTSVMLTVARAGAGLPLAGVLTRAALDGGPPEGAAAAPAWPAAASGWAAAFGRSRNRTVPPRARTTTMAAASQDDARFRRAPALRDAGGRACRGSPELDSGPSPRPDVIAGSLTGVPASAGDRLAAGPE